MAELKIIRVEQEPRTPQVRYRGIYVYSEHSNDIMTTAIYDTQSEALNDAKESGAVVVGILEIKE